ncbi:S-layer homology domain-containing protein [Paenibacillus endoradicis]|uniref:S-layer homology domain-containing protein n=1 Tax=Paenibacillus endoradicis TaxID=2972487 RepID=UPI0021590183|nr:S-layer homology domain-containing protein [Paenibacillus endoradicis]MCR8659076.1 S-layer homology domain-containing protein [Paenibacillus endoradicis]
MKKHLAIAAVAVMISASLTTQVFAANSFSDINSLSSKTQIEALQQLGIIKGVSDTSFNPEDKLTAAQGISLIVRATQISLAAIDFSTAPTADGFYKKVSNDAWYAQDFIIAHYNGLDIPADIDPNQPLTKEQFTHYLVQALELTGQYPTIKMFIPIEDEKDITVDYQGTIQRALLYKIVSLDESGKFDPSHLLTRAEAAAILFDAHSFIEAHKDNVTPEEPEAKS